VLYEKILKRLLKFRNDFRGEVGIYLHNKYWVFIRVISKAATILICFLKGIKIGKGCTFFGIPIFIRFPGSKIVIGNNVIFRSNASSNYIGLNHRCIIVAKKKDAEIFIGDNSGLSGTSIVADTKIIIGENVLCGANVQIRDSDAHNLDPALRRQSSGVKTAPIFIEKNAWLGMNSVILKGVRIGENSVIGANSIVTKTMPSNVVAAGNRCKIIKSL